MNIGALHKGKGYKGKGYGKGQGYGYKGKGGKGQGKGSKGYSKGKTYKGKGPIGQGQIHSGKAWQQQGNKRKGKSKNKGKTAVNIGYRCGLEGRYAKDCKVAYSLNDTATQQQGPQDQATAWWTDTGQAYENAWWHGDQAMTHQTHQLMLPPPTETASAHQQQGIQQPATQGQAV